MMPRREFLRRLCWGLGAGWALSRLSWPLAALAGSPGPRLALLADAHLKDGDEGRPEAQALARAVAEIRALRPRPDLVLFAGDLAHKGNPQALALGREILADLPAPPLMVMGEGDGLPEAAAPWRRLFGEPWFSQSFPLHPYRGVVGEFEGRVGELLSPSPPLKTKAIRVLGLHTAWCPGPGGPVFRLGEAQRRWLARELAHLDSATPLIILSHAPLTQIFRPWQQWTKDGETLLPLLARFSHVLCVHGHVHGAGARGQGSVVSTENKKQKTENQPFHQGLPATAWPLPQPWQGTPAALRPGLGPSGCGWGLVALQAGDFHFLPHLWRA